MVEKAKLKRNFSLMFWVQALTEVKVINVISTLFLMSRGLSLSQIILLGVVFSGIVLLSEVPSSYLADRWGRKKIIILSIIMALFYWTINIFAHSEWLIVAIAFYALSWALMSGTDEALIYDTAKELGEEENSLKNLGQYYSAQRIFKMITPLIAVLIAKDLNDQQYVLLLLIDVVANFGALFLSFFLKEPKHFFGMEKMELGVFRDALRIFKDNRTLLINVLNRSILFIAIFMVWRVFSEYFVSLGASILVIGLTSVSYQILTFCLSVNVEKIFRSYSNEKKINILNTFLALTLLLFFVNQIWWRSIVVAVITYVICNVSESLRWPFFSKIFNEQSNSYNRATTLSLASLTKSVLDIPFLLLASILVTYGYSALFGFCLAISLATILFLRVSRGSSDTGIR